MRHALRSFLLLAAAAATLSASAGETVKKQSVRLDRPAWVGETLLPAGDYRVVLSPDLDKATFTQGKRTVAEAPVRVALTRPVYPGNAVHYRAVSEGGDRLVKIVFAKDKLAADFAAGSAEGDPTGVAKAADLP